MIGFALSNFLFNSINLILTKIMGNKATLNWVSSVFCLSLSVVDRICVATFLTFVKDCATLISRSGLDDVIFHLWMVTFRAFLLNYHLGLSSLLLFNLWFVLVQPFLVLLYLHVCTDCCADELLKRKGVLAYVAGNKTIDCV